ncbi:MAG: anti-sigma factor, partial [Myxococcota bacterium]
MNHADVKHHLADYLEGDLPLDERARVDAHLDGCPECAQEVNEMLQTIRLLHLLPEPETPPMIAANVMRRIRAGETEPGWFERIGRALGSVLEPSFVLPASAIAVAALVVMVVQEPDFVSRLSIAGPRAVEGQVEKFFDRGEAESGVAAKRFESEMAGLDLDLAQTFGASIVQQPPQSAEPRTRISIEIPSATTRARLFGLTDFQFFEVADSQPPGVADAQPPWVADAQRVADALAPGVAGAQAVQSGNEAALAANPAAVRTRFKSNSSASLGLMPSNPDSGVVVSRPPQARSQNRPRRLVIADNLGGNPAVNRGRARRVAQPRRVD